MKIKGKVKRILCPICGRELIPLEFCFQPEMLQIDALAFWCDDCNIDITVEAGEDAIC